MEKLTEGNWVDWKWRDGWSELIGPIKMLEYNGPDGEFIRLGCEIVEKHCNRMDMCHGAMIASLLDNALGINCNLMSGSDAPAPTISLSMDFLNSVKLGEWVESRVTVLKLTRSMAFVEGRLITAEGGIVARGNALFKRARRD